MIEINLKQVEEEGFNVKQGDFYVFCFSRLRCWQSDVFGFDFHNIAVFGKFSKIEYKNIKTMAKSDANIVKYIKI